MLSNGNMIKLHTVSGKTVEGEVFAIDPVTKTVVLKVEGNYVVFNPTHISKIEGDITTLRAPPVGELGIKYVTLLDPLIVCSRWCNHLSHFYFPPQHRRHREARGCGPEAGREGPRRRQLRRQR